MRKNETPSERKGQKSTRRAGKRRQGATHRKRAARWTPVSSLGVFSPLPSRVCANGGTSWKMCPASGPSAHVSVCTAAPCDAERTAVAGTAACAPPAIWQRTISRSVTEVVLDDQSVRAQGRAPTPEVPGCIDIHHVCRGADWLGVRQVDFFEIVQRTGARRRS